MSKVTNVRGDALVKKFEVVDHPSKFENQLLSTMVEEPPVNKVDFDVDFIYIAVTDKEVNFPGDKYRGLLIEEVAQESLIDGMLNSQPRMQHGFGTGETDVMISTWTAIAGEDDDGNKLKKPHMAVFVLIDVTTISPSSENPTVH